MTQLGHGALFWVFPCRQLKELFAALHDLTDIDEAMRLSALHDVDFYAEGGLNKAPPDQDKWS